MANKKKHLSQPERFCIEKMLGVGKSFGEIARTLGRGLSTISEEVNGSGGRECYAARKAATRAYFRQYRKKRECNKVAMNGHLYRFVEKRLAQGWSPETISARLERQSGLPYASAKSIRKFINKRPSLERFLFWERNRMKSGRKRKQGAYLRDPSRRFIEERPLEALTSYGHWEGDFIVSKENAWVLLVLVERYTKMVRLILLPNRNNDLVNEAVVSLLERYMANTLTLDNDIAFTKWEQLEAMLGTQIFFCHPYHSWEKGLVENTNRWIRVFIPKKADLATYTKEDVQRIEDWLNHTPRQCLQGATPYEMMMEREYQKFVTSLDINLPALRIRG